MKDAELQKLEDNTNKAWESAIGALTNVINCITMERNYYRERCQEVVTPRADL